MMQYKAPMTVAEAIERLKQLPQDAKLVHGSWDSEFMGTHFNHVYDFSDNGFVLTGLCKEDWYEEDNWDDYEDEDCEDCKAGSCEPHYIPSKTYTVEGEQK